MGQSAATELLRRIDGDEDEFRTTFCDIAQYESPGANIRSTAGTRWCQASNGSDAIEYVPFGLSERDEQ